MLTKIQKCLLAKHKELQKKSQILEYYVSLQYPQKQRKMIIWWQQMIDLAIRESQDIYLNLDDLQIIFNLHGLKPVPLQKVIEYLIRQQKIQILAESIQSKGKQSSGGWFGNIANSLWRFGSQSQNQKKTGGEQVKKNSKILSKKYKNEQVQKIKNIIQQKMQHERSINYQYIFRVLKSQLPLSTNSIQLLLIDLQKRNWLTIETIQNKKVLFHSQQLLQLDKKKWIQIQKSKYILKSTIQMFDLKIDQKLNQQGTKLKQAKQCVNDKNKVKRLLGHVRAMRKNTQQLQNRRKLLVQTLNQLQISQINQTTIDVMGPVMQIIKDKNLQFSINQKQLNEQLQYLANLNQSQIQEQTNNLLAQLQKQVMQKNKDKYHKQIGKQNYIINSHEINQKGIQNNIN